MVSEKRAEMAAPRAIAEHIWTPEFRAPRSDTLQNGIRKANRNDRPACDCGAFFGSRNSAFPVAIRARMVSEKRAEMVAPRAIAEHFWTPKFRVPRSDTLQNGIRKASRNGRPACDRGAYLDPGGPVFGQSYVPVLEAIETLDRDFRVTGTGLRLRLRASGFGFGYGMG